MTGMSWMPADGEASLPFMRRYLEDAPAASAVVSGAAHALVFGNAAFRHFSDSADAYAVGVPIATTLPPGARAGMQTLLDRVRRDGVAVRDARVGPTPRRAVRRDLAAWCCDVWPMAEDAGRLDYLMVTIRAARRGAGTRARQRAITERLLFTALREQDLARLADVSRTRAVFLAEASRRLGASFELETVYAAVARVALPAPGAWCIVDLVRPDGSWYRLPVAHPDPMKAALVRELDGHWSPAPGDPLGAPLVALSRSATIVDDDIDAVLAVSAHGPDNLRILRALGLGSLLVVPLIAHGRYQGAITFVSPTGAAPFADDDIQLAEDLAIRCANLIDGARLYDDARLAQLDADAARGLAETARKDAEDANRTKTAFLTSMSHELRTPLNAILGYSELLLMGLRGSLTDDQKDSLSRIRRAGTHLLSLINDVLNFAKLKALKVGFLVADVPVNEMLESASSMVGPQVSAKALVFEREPCAPTVVMRADPEKLLQILLNLLSNSVKFTDTGGRVTLAAAMLDRRQPRTDDATHADSPVEMPIRVTVSDTGRGIAAEQLKSIFEPFVQVGRRLVGTDAGIGLGLAISRDLARGMGGDLTVESTLGVGSTFTLTMPCAAPA